MKAAERMRPILETWIQSKEEDANGGNKFTKKRRKRTSFAPEYIQYLNDRFQSNPKPTIEEMQVIANKINLDLTTVKVWFCNKKQSLKRVVQPSYRGNGGKMIKPETPELDKRKRSKPESPGIFPLNTAGGMKTLLPVSTPTGTVTMPFFISQDGNAIPIVSGGAAGINTATAQTVAAQSAAAAAAGQQHIVHLSQVPILTSMAVVNNTLQNNGTGEGTPAQLIQGGRIIPSGSVLQIPGGAITGQQPQLQQASLNQAANSLNDGTVIIGTAPGGTSLPVNGSNRNNENIMLQKSPLKGIKTASEISEKDLEADEVCVSDDSNKSEKLQPRRNNNHVDISVDEET